MSVFVSPKITFRLRAERVDYSIIIAFINMWNLYIHNRVSTFAVLPWALGHK